jgi:hypothetical protein
MALEMRPSCARLGRARRPSPHKLGQTLGWCWGSRFFVRFEFPFLGSFRAALTMEMLTELERLLQ